MVELEPEDKPEPQEEPQQQVETPFTSAFNLSRSASPQEEPQQEAETQDRPPEEPVPADDEAADAGIGGLDIGLLIRRAWDVVTENPLETVAGWAIVAAILCASALTIAGFVVLLGPMLFGFFWILGRLMKEEPASLGELFDGFKDFRKPFVMGLLLSLVIAVMAGIAFLINMIPVVGLIATVIMVFFVKSLLYFAVQIAAFSDASPVEAMAKSCRFALDNIGPVLLLTLVTVVIALVGVIACGIGWFFTVPLGLAIGVAAYNEYYLPKAE